MSTPRSTPAHSPAESRRARGWTSTDVSAAPHGGASPETADWLAPARGGRAGSGRARSAAIVAVLSVAGVVVGAAFVLARLSPAPATPLADPPARGETADAATGVGPDDGTAPGGTPRPGGEGAKWRPAKQEVYPNAKRLSARVVESLTTFAADADAADVADATARRFGTSPAKLRRASNELVRLGARSTGTVVYPQLAGVGPDSAAVMVVVDQTLEDGDDVWVERRTVDVRLRLEEQSWVLDGVGSAGGVAMERPAQLSQESVTVLDHPSIRLTDSARWDIYSGKVADRLLRLMARAADRHTFAVVAISTGHPPNVFGTDRTSNHTMGRAVDIFTVDDEAVVGAERKRSPAYRLTRWLYREGVPELGSPWDLDGDGGRSFTDDVHADHIHVSVAG